MAPYARAALPLGTQVWRPPAPLTTAPKARSPTQCYNHSKFRQLMSALCQKWTHAPQQISSLLDRLVSRFVAARFLDAEDHAVARIGCALRHDRGDAGPA